MRPRVWWMNELDESILEFLSEINADDQVSLPPTPVWYNIAEERDLTDKETNTFSRRMNNLAAAGLLEKVDENRGYYTITDIGERFLTNDLTDQEHRDLRNSGE